MLACGVGSRRVGCWPQTMASHAYPRAARLRRRAEFVRILRSGRATPGRECVVRTIAAPGSIARLGIAAPRRYGNAIRRNRFRRLVREAFRLSASDLGAFDYLVTPRKALREPTLDGIARDLRAAHARARRAERGGDAR